MRLFVKLDNENGDCVLKYIDILLPRMVMDRSCECVTKVRVCCQAVQLNVYIKISFCEVEKNWLNVWNLANGSIK